jgi:hypothetical protein
VVRCKTEARKSSECPFETEKPREEKLHLTLVRSDSLVGKAKMTESAPAKLLVSRMLLKFPPEAQSTELHLAVIMHSW